MYPFEILNRPLPPCAPPPTCDLTQKAVMANPGGATYVKVPARRWEAPYPLRSYVRTCTAVGAASRSASVRGAGLAGERACVLWAGVCVCVRG